MVNFWMGALFIYIGAMLWSMTMESQSFIGATALTSSASVAATTLVVGDTGSFPSSGIRGFIGREEFSWTGKTATSFTGVVRGINSTTPTVHANGIRVYNETSGLVNLGIDFNVLEFSASNSVGANIIEVFTAPFELIGMFGKLLAKLLLWDYGWLEGDMVVLKYFFYVFGAGLLLSSFLIFRRI